MKRTHLLLTLILILASTNLALACWTEEAFDISYQIDDSDRIVVGNVTDIQKFAHHSLVTVEVDEWLRNPLPSEVINIETESGTLSEVSTAVHFTVGEEVILMLEDVDVSENRFKVLYGQPGKHPISDKDEILRELEKLPDFVPHIFDELNQEPRVIETHGTIPKFETEEERRNWLDELDKTGRNVDMSPYFYPEGPVIEHGNDYQGYLTVKFLEGSEINESTINEIYQIFDQQGRQMNIQEVPVVFEYGEIPVEEEGYSENEGSPQTPGFTAIALVMALSLVFRRENR